MGAEPEEEGLIVTDSDTPVLRAGFSNVLLGVLPGTYFLNMALADLGVAPLARGAMVLGVWVVALTVYSHSVSRIFIKDGKTLVIVGPLRETHVHADDILDTDVLSIASCMWVCAKVKRKSSSVPAFYHFVAPVTNYGGCADTADRLRLLLKRLTDVHT